MLDESPLGTRLKEAIDTGSLVSGRDLYVVSPGRTHEHVRKLNERDDTGIERMRELQTAVEEALAKGLLPEEPE